MASHNVTLAYRGPLAVHNLSGVFARGSLTAIVGPNGAGKSPLMKGMVGLLRPADGLIQPAGLGNRGIAFLPPPPQIERGFPTFVVQTSVAVRWRAVARRRALRRGPP